MFFDISVYLSIFLTAFIAATILPAQSEVLLSGFLILGQQPIWALIAIAWLGNSLGSVVNWLLGRYFHHFQGRRWFPIKANTLQKAEYWYHKYGRWSLLLSWAPIVGDPLTILAGILREPFWSFLALVAIAKLVRYLVVAAVTLHWLV